MAKIISYKTHTSGVPLGGIGSGGSYFPQTGKRGKGSTVGRASGAWKNISGAQALERRILQSLGR